MNEEEKKAIDELNSFKNIPNYVFLNEYELLMQSTRIVLNLVEKLQKENEELKEINNELEAEKNETIRRYNFETIPIKKVKDKIEKLNDDFHAEELEDIMIGGNYTITELVQYVLQELIEEREGK